MFSQGSVSGAEDVSVVEVEMPRALLDAIQDERDSNFESPTKTGRRFLDGRSYEDFGRVR